MAGYRIVDDGSPPEIAGNDQGGFDTLDDFPTNDMVLCDEGGHVYICIVTDANIDDSDDTWMEKQLLAGHTVVFPSGVAAILAPD